MQTRQGGHEAEQNTEPDSTVEAPPEDLDTARQPTTRARQGPTTADKENEKSLVRTSQRRPSRYVTSRLFM